MKVIYSDLALKYQMYIIYLCHVAEILFLSLQRDSSLLLRYVMFFFKVFIK